eukprot:406583-Pleurochrysis_carterae.AAC.2
MQLGDVRFQARCLVARCVALLLQPRQKRLVLYFGVGLHLLDVVLVRHARLLSCCCCTLLLCCCFLPNIIPLSQRAHGLLVEINNLCLEIIDRAALRIDFLPKTDALELTLNKYTA